MRLSVCRLMTAGAVMVAAAVGYAVAAPGVDLDRDPINYPTAPTSRLQKRLASGEVKLPPGDEHGYLRPLLKALDVPESSQVLVFSKTSLQRDRISPKTPRAIYFNDDVYVGFCLRGEVLELSAVDPDLGTVFYTLDQEPAERPRFTRHADNCMICHASSLNRGFPGHLVRSVKPDRSGNPILSAGTKRIDHTSPFEDRWGGWYVTGTHGKQEHLGNVTYGKRYGDDERPSDDGQNVTDLRDRFTTAFYPTPHSDLVALMVLEHQGEMHNRISRATLDVRLALHQQAELNRALKEPPAFRGESTTGRIRSAGDAVLQCLLFCDEAKLTDKVAGTSRFAEEFAARGPKDGRGRSLREFDLTTRMFRYPCSYLVHSEAFDRMPAEVRDYVLRRLYDVLTGKDRSKEFAHLSDADRRAVLEILRDTKPNLPGYWLE